MLKNLILAPVRWLDSGVGYDPNDKRDPNLVDWYRIIPFLGMHLMCFAVIWVGWSPVAVGVAAVLYFFRMFAITGFYHRYFSHRSYKTSRAMQFVMAIIGSAAVQRGPMWWAAHHRKHHRHSDQEGDVHSPHLHGFWWSHMFWLTTPHAFPTDYKAVPDLNKYPELRFLDRFDLLVPLALGFFTFGLGMWLNYMWPSLGTSGFQMLIWGFFVSTVVLFHCTCFINSLAHLIGKRRYETTDESKNSFILAIICLGEGWHNNHHKYPGVTRNGFFFWEIDITYYMLRMLSWVGLIWDLNPVPEAAKIEAKKGRSAVSELANKAAEKAREITSGVAPEHAVEGPAA